MLGTHLSILLHEAQEGLLVTLPAEKDIARFVKLDVEKPAKEHPVAEFSLETQGGSHFSKFLEDDIIKIWFTLSLHDDLMDFGDGLFYNNRLASEETQI